MGDGGNREGLTNHWETDVDGISAFTNGVDYGYGRVLANATHAEWMWYKVVAEGEEWERGVIRGSVVGDRVVVERKL